MRPSSYVFFAHIPSGDATILFQGALGHVDKVPRHVAEFLHESRIDAEVIDKFNITETVLRRLVSRGYITTLTSADERQSFTSYAAALHEQTLRSQTAGFSIIPTYACNLRCFYCFQNHTLHNDNRVITPRLIDLAFDVITQHMPPKRKDGHAYIKLYGGEPLLKQNRAAVIHILKRSEQLCLQVKAISNGTELEAYYDLLGPTRISHLQITIDGPRSIHDERRIGPNWPATFDTILNNIDEALQRGTNVTVRMNVDDANARHVTSLYAELEQRGWTKLSAFSFHPATISASQSHPARRVVTTGGLFNILQDNTAGETSCSMSSTAERIIGQLSKEGRILGSRTAYCGANLGYYILDPFGDVYACENEAGDPTKRLGHYDTGELLLNLKSQQQWRGRSIAAIPECSQCPVALLCGGGCGFNAAFQSGEFFSPYCDGIKAHLAKVLPIAYDRAYSTDPLLEAPHSLG